MMSISLDTVTAPARRLVWAFGGAIGVLGLAGIAVLAIYAAYPRDVAQWIAELGGAQTQGMGAAQGAALMAIALVPLCLWLAALWQGLTLSRKLARADMEAAGRAARALALWLWAILLWSILGEALGTVIGSWHLGEGNRTLSISLDPFQLSTALAALVAALLARAFAVTARLWQDHREIV